MNASVRLELALAITGAIVAVSQPGLAQTEAAPTETPPEPQPTTTPPPATTPAPPAEPPVQSATPPEPKPEEPKPDSFIDKTMAHSWWEGPNRWFLSTIVDAGYLYLRPRASFGYGLPFTRWGGVDVNPVFSGAGLGVYGGARVAVPHFDLRAGSRYFFVFQRSYLAPQDLYRRIDLDRVSQDRARIVTHEAEATFDFPVGPGDVNLLAGASYVTGVPQGSYVFEETLHVIVAPPLVWRGRGAYFFRLGEYSQHSLGIAVDVLDVPKRDDSVTVRAGPVGRFVLSRHFEVRGSFVVTMISPDRIGLIGGDFTELGVRYRWATGE